MKFYLERTNKELKHKFNRWHPDITNAEFKTWPKKELLKFHQYVTSNLECKPGDPADLKKFKQTLISVTLAGFTPTDYTTTSWNDPNVWDLHRHEILPYKPPTNPAATPPTMSNIESQRHRRTIDESKMTSGQPEITNANSKRLEYPKEQRYRMLHENPATVCMWFFIRQMINMDVMRQCSYPVAYEKWYARKFEFQDRGSVHEHAVKQMIFVWIKSEANDKKADDLTATDFDEIMCRTDKLSMYAESGKIREIIIGRILTQIRKQLNKETISNDMKKNLKNLKTIFYNHQKWIHCKNKTTCPENHDTQMCCANKTLRQLAKQIDSEGINVKNFIPDMSTNNDNNDDDNDMNYTENAFATFKHISVTYEDPTLQELSEWTTPEGFVKLTEMLTNYKEWILLGRHAEQMIIAIANARIPEPQ